ncbi:MAG TPA: Ser-Thr-rich GPI-anchored membrane family protein, partial [Candidatus Anammoximicrobium sp.]|nr:Ser-Thr-rich GPI-anchored membrane family protein [Candidatus Anammoximicrobium sp.]
MHAHGAITTVGQTVVVLLVLSAGAFGQEPPARDRDVTITITSPNGGEVWTAGTYQTITWTPTGGWPFSAEISLWKSGAFYTYIGTTSSSYGSYDWLVCPLVGDGADYTVHIAITDSPTPAEDDSDAPFEITGSAPVPTLAVTSPNGGESWVAGKTQTITWSSTDPSGYVAAWLYQGGERDLFVGHVPMSAGELTWDVPPYLGDASDYTIRLTWVDECGPAREDFSDGPFAVTDS